MLIASPLSRSANVCCIAKPSVTAMMLEVAKTAEIGNSKTKAESDASAIPKITIPRATFTNGSARWPFAPRTRSIVAKTIEIAALSPTATAIHHTTPYACAPSRCGPSGITCGAIGSAPISSSRHDTNATTASAVTRRTTAGATRMSRYPRRGARWRAP